MTVKMICSCCNGRFWAKKYCLNFSNQSSPEPCKVARLGDDKLVIGKLRDRTFVSVHVCHCNWPMICNLVHAAATPVTNLWPIQDERGVLLE